MQICEALHLKGTFENLIVEATLCFKDATTTNMIDLELFAQDIQVNYDLLGNVESDLEILHGNLEIKNMKLNNL